MNVLDLFSGIGGFSLGLERAGMRTVAFCEIDPFCRQVLKKHWPHVPCYDDVRTLTADRLRADGIAVDVICGGFPCQDISVAGKGAGIEGNRSGLWSEYARIIGEVRPRYVIVENVAALLSRGLERVLGDLAALGFDAEWHCIPASAVGAPHRRDRLWIVAYAASRSAAELVADADRRGRREQGDVSETALDARAGQPSDRCAAPSDAENFGCAGGACVAEGSGAVIDRSGGHEMGIAGGARLPIGPGTLREWAHAATTGTGWWTTEPDVGRVVDGPAARVDRRKRLIAIGNAVVPQIPELIGRAIMKSMVQSS